MSSRRTLLVACALLASGLVVTAPVDGAAAAGKPDLVVTAVSAATRAEQGGRLAVKATVRNRGSAGAGATATAFYLSTDRARGQDRKLAPTWRPGRLRPGKAATATTKVKVPDAVAVGSYFVLACADSARDVREGNERNNCRATGRTVAVDPPPSSHDLIEDAVAAGEITEEEGLVFQVFSDFGDPRLPERFVAEPTGLGEGALAEAAGAWDGLSGAAQETLRPFLIPPFYAGSHWSPVTPTAVTGRAAETPSLDAPWCSGSTDVQPLFETWSHLDTTGGEARIWWLASNTADATTAAHLRDELENKILPALVGLMGTGPKPDGGGACDGGSPALDIALVDAATATTYADGGCGATGTSAHMLFPRTAAGAGWAGLDPYLAHEVMHAIQYAMPVAGGCGTYQWLREMTAQWVQDYVTDPSYGIGVAPDDTEWAAAPIYLNDPQVSLDVASPPAHHDYGDYLLALWGARKGGPTFVRDIWTAAASHGPVDALDGALPGGFEATWADFALANWNRDPVTDYADWDGLTDGAAVVGTQRVPVETPQHATVTVEHLAAKYLEVELDPKVKELEVTNDLHGDAHAKIRAVLTYDDGTHDVVDLSDEKTVLCIDDGSKRATEVVLVFSNAHKVDQKVFAPTLVGKKSCGCASSSGGVAPPGAATADGGVCTLDGNLTFSWSDEATSPDWHSTENGSGSLSLNLVADPDDPDQYASGPGSTYTVSMQRHAEYYRHSDDHCGDEIADVTEEGSGALDEGMAAALIEHQTGELWVGSMISMPTTWTFDNVVVCIGPQHETMESSLITPECPFVPNEWDPFYEFVPTGPDSRTFTFSCSGSADWEDSSGRQHHTTTTVSGTLTLPG